MAAVSLGNSFVFVAMSLGIGFSTAITPMIAEYFGAKITLRSGMFCSRFDPVFWIGIDFGTIGAVGTTAIITNGATPRGCCFG